jgi:hypothetical protein
MLVCRLAMLVSGLGMGLGVIMLPLFMMMSRLMVVVSLQRPDRGACEWSGPHPSSQICDGDGGNG